MFNLAKRKIIRLLCQNFSSACFFVAIKVILENRNFVVQIQMTQRFDIGKS